MEFKPQDIAKLVLGYLREQKCQTAFCQFLSSSSYLKEHVSSYRRGKYIVTRVNGLGLIDYLAEYALVYSIVQEHIEASDYYNERGLRTSLAQQLLYLLGTRSGIETRTSTPIEHPITINDSHQENIPQTGNTLEPIDNNSFEIINDEINATPIQSLPGNSSTILSFLSSPKNQAVSSSPTVNKSTDTGDDADKEKSQEMCKEYFTQTFLENAELIEKLADNINKEVSAKSSCTSNDHIGQELDNTAIETIIQRIAKEPIIINSIEEIMSGNQEDERESSASPDKNVQNTQNRAESSTSKEQALFSTPKKTQNIPSPSECIKTRLRSSKKSCPSPVDNTHTIEEQNNLAVRSIVTASLSSEKRPLDQESNASTDPQSVSVGEVILSEPYGNFMHSGTLAGSSNQNQIYVNTVNSGGGLLMLQSSGTTPCSNIVSTKSLQVDSMKPYYVIGNQPFNNVIIPQTPFKVNNVLTEQEIMAMPTIIVCDNNQQCTSNTQTVIVPTSATSISTSNLRTIAPRKTAEKVNSLSEYLSVYQCNDPSSPIISQRQLESSPPNVKSKLRTSSTTLNTNRTKKKTDKKPTPGSLTQTSKIDIHSEISATENSKDILKNVTGESISSKMELDSVHYNPSQEHEQNSLRSKFIGESMPQIMTPKMIAQDIKERRSRSTPRNGSHIRQLDFSTPEKWCPLVRRANTSPKVDKPSENKETPVKAPKSGASKSIRTSLFKSPDSEFPAVAPDLSTVSEKNNERNKVDLDTNPAGEITGASVSQPSKTMRSCNVNLSWDADLRALTAPTDTKENITQKQKRKRSEESSKERSTSKKPKENLNKTEDDALKIEIALGSTVNHIELAETAVAHSVQEDTKKNVKVPNTRRNRITTKKAISVSKIIKNDSEKQKPVKAAEVGLDLPDNSAVTAVKINSSEDVKPVLDNHQKIASEDNAPEKQYAVINRHVKSRIKKKCNMENSTKKTQLPEEVIFTNITKIKSCEILDESKNKLILSPSKMNANKRTLVEVENRSPIETSVATKMTCDGNEEVTDSKFITPELVKNSSNIPPTAAKRNIMPILETPVKFDMITFPKTPSICSPPTIDTPFTKAVLDQLTGVDINAIPTPKFPITPHVPFTPTTGNEQSPFSNRATDYSTSSSYYQPSDTEQNKSLEQLIEECRKMDSEPIAETSKPQELRDDCEGTVSSSISASGNTQNIQICEVTKMTEAHDPINQSNSPEVINTSVTDKMKAFNHSMIGKKNLQLVKMFSNETEKDESSSCDSSSTTGSSSSSSSDDSDSSDSSFTDGGVKTPAKNVTPYSLRPRKSLTSNAAVNLDASKNKLEEHQNVALDKEQHPEKNKEKPLTFQDGLLQEMEQKRQRTIARFKDANSTTKAKENIKQKKHAPKTKEGAKKDESNKFSKNVTSKKCVGNKANIRKATPSKQICSGIIANKSSTNEPNTQVKKQQKSDLPKKLKQLESSSEKNTNSVTTQSHPTKSSFFSTKIAKATVNDDKEIILHLSSDEENLEPSEMVEAVLLECSTSSASVGEENRATHMQYIEVPSVSTFGKGLNLKSTTTNEQESPGSLDQEAETLVKLQGLMQMGIHLIPNKAAKKAALSADEREQHNLQTNENTGKSDQPTKSNIKEMPRCAQSEDLQKAEIPQEGLAKSARYKKKTENLERPGTSTETAENLEKPSKLKESPKSSETLSLSKQQSENLEKLCTSKEKPGKPHTSKQNKTENEEKSGMRKENSAKKENDKLNRSIEEGELISDDENSPRRKSKFEKHKADKIKKIEPKRLSDSLRNNDNKPKERKSFHDRLRNFSEQYKYRPRSEKQSKEPITASVSKKLSVSKSSKPNENRSTNKSSKLGNESPKKMTESKCKDESITSNENQTAIDEVDYQVQFDIKTYTEETHAITHDYSKKINRRLSDYNLDILTKKFSANVYIAEIDSEVEKFLTFTPFQFLLDISPKQSTKLVEKKAGSVSNTIDKTQFSKEHLKNKKKPLNILYNQLIKAAVEPPRSSPLEDLYAPESTSRESKRSNEGSREKACDKSRKSEKSENINRTKSTKQKSVKEKPTEEQSHYKSLDCTSKESTSKYKDHGKIEDQELTNAVHKGDTKSAKDSLSINRESLECDSAINNEQSTKRLLQDLEQDLEVVDGVIMLNANREEQKKEEMETSFEANDELMNYALIGSDRTDDNEEFFIADNRKRKIPEVGEKQQEKKQKTEELLRNIDVDSFLKQLHGET